MTLSTTPRAIIARVCRRMLGVHPSTPVHIGCGDHVNAPPHTRGEHAHYHPTVSGKHYRASSFRVVIGGDVYAECVDVVNMAKQFARDLARYDRVEREAYSHRVGRWGARLVSRTS